MLGDLISFVRPDDPSGKESKTVSVSDRSTSCMPQTLNCLPITAAGTIKIIAISSFLTCLDVSFHRFQRAPLNFFYYFLLELEENRCFKEPDSGYDFKNWRILFHLEAELKCWNITVLQSRESKSCSFHLNTWFLSGTIPKIAFAASLPIIRSTLMVQAGGSSLCEESWVQEQGDGITLILLEGTIQEDESSPRRAAGQRGGHSGCFLPRFSLPCSKWPIHDIPLKKPVWPFGEHGGKLEQAKEKQSSQGCLFSSATLSSALLTGAGRVV